MPTLHCVCRLSFADIYANRINAKVLGHTGYWTVLRPHTDASHILVREFVPQSEIIREFVLALALTASQPIFCIGAPPKDSVQFWERVAASGAWIGDDIPNADAIHRSCLRIRNEAARLRELHAIYEKAQAASVRLGRW